jgi:hypothetical protein
VLLAHDMVRLIWHAGMGKTGTTALQWGLSTLAPQLQQQGVAVLSDAPGVEASRQGLDIQSDALLQLHTGKSCASVFRLGALLSKASGEAQEVSQGFVAKVDEALESWARQYETLILSAESLEFDTDSAAFVSLLKRWAAKASVSVLVVVRPQGEMALARWAQYGWVGAGEQLSSYPREWLNAPLANYWGWAQLLQSKLPTVRLVVRPHTRPKAGRGSGLSDLLSLLPGDVKPEVSHATPRRRRNMSWPAEAIPGLCLLARTLGRAEANRVRGQLKIALASRAVEYSWSEQTRQTMKTLRKIISAVGLAKHSVGNAKLAQQQAWSESERQAWLPVEPEIQADWEGVERLLRRCSQDSLVGLASLLTQEFVSCLQATDRR